MINWCYDINMAPVCFCGDNNEKKRLLRIAERWLDPRYAAINPPRLKKRDALALETLGFRINSEKSGYEPRYWYLVTTVPLMDRYDRKTVSVNLDRLKELQGELSS